MSTIHITTGDGQSVEYDEEQVTAMLQQGLLPGNALYWREGMIDWQRLQTLIEPTSPPPFLPSSGPATGVLILTDELVLCSKCRREISALAEICPCCGERHEVDPYKLSLIHISEPTRPY